MEAPSQASPPMIALRDIRLGGRLHEGGDLVDLDHYEAKGEITPRHRRIFDEQRIVGPLNRENYERATGRRPPGTVGAGFTIPYLVKMGIIDGAPEGAKEPTPVATPRAQNKDPVPYKGQIIVPVLVGRFTQFEVKSEAGELLRAKRFRKVDAAKAFIDEIPPEKEPEKAPVEDEAASGVSEGSPAERADGSDLQPEPERPALEG
jgi:hypothetical protein